MASGLPVIAANSGGMRDMVLPGQTGILCTPRQPQSFVQGITSLLDNQDRMASFWNEARNFALGRSWDSIFDHLIERFMDVAGATYMPVGEVWCGVRGTFELLIWEGTVGKQYDGEIKRSLCASSPLLIFGYYVLDGFKKLLHFGHNASSYHSWLAQIPHVLLRVKEICQLSVISTVCSE